MRFRIDIKIFLFLLIFVFTNQIEIYVMILFFCLVHELAHLLAGLLLKMKPNKMELNPLGLSISFALKPEDYNKKIGKGTVLALKKFLIAIAGPLVNIIIATYFCLTKNVLECQTIIYANVLIGLLNLMPIYPLDGGRMLKSILHICIGKKEAEKITNKTANILIIILTVISSIAIFYYKNIAIFFIITYLWFLILNENKRYRLFEKIQVIMEEDEYKNKLTYKDEQM